MASTYEVFIEIPQGTKGYKFEREPQSGRLFLDFVFENLIWPFNYGELLNTRAGDGDCLDAIVYSSHPLQMGAVADCVPFGVLLTVDRGAEDNKILMAPAADPLSRKLVDIKNLNAGEKNKLRSLYAEIARQKQKSIKILGFKNRKFALGLIAAASF